MVQCIETPEYVLRIAFCQMRFLFVRICFQRYSREKEMIFELQQTEEATPLFAGWQETMIWSCLQGVMGRIYVNSLKNPSSAMALLGDFCFLAGKPDRELAVYEPGPDRENFRILVPRSRGWEELIEACYGKKAEKVVRYAMKKEADVFDRKELRTIADRVPDGYCLQRMDEILFWRCRKIAWCRDWVRQYDDYAAYQKYGLGMVMLKEGEPVSGASSYSGYRGGIEIEIDTREDFRRRGFARICGAELILECLERGWYPSWDAENTWSVALAEGLGYHFDHVYTAYKIMRERSVL